MEIAISGVEDTMQIQWKEFKENTREYIQNQLKEDLEYDQMTLKEYIDPFTGEPVNKKN